jgi:hypothetical protein
MSTVTEIENAIRKLGDEDLAALRAWFAEFDASAWDRQFERDVSDGRLDALADEALRDLRSEVPMRTRVENTVQDDNLRPEYDRSVLTGGVRGKYLERYRSGTNLALLAPDVRAAFPTDEAVNQALRSLPPTRDA